MTTGTSLTTESSAGTSFAIGAGTGTSTGSWTGGTSDFFGAIGSFLIFGTDDITDSCMEGDGITAGTSLLFLISATCSSIIGASATIGSSSKTGTDLTTDDVLTTGTSTIGASASGIATTGSEGSEATEGTDGRAGANGSLYTFVFEFDESVDSVDILFIVSYFIFFINSSFQKGKGLLIVLFYDT